jgi:TPR repeat protein
MKILVTALFLIFATAVWAGVVKEEELTFAPKLAEELGLIAYGKGNFTKAASLFKKGAERGESHSQFRLGEMYERGKGVLHKSARRRWEWN